MKTKVGSMVRICYNGDPGCRAYVGYWPGPVTSLIKIRGVVHSVEVYGKFHRSWIVVKDSTRKVAKSLHITKP